jgi:multidrug resistance protein, MATE family
MATPDTTTVLWLIATVACPAAITSLLRNAGPALILGLVGHESSTEAEISALGLASTFTAVTGLSIIIGLTTGLDTLLPQLFGANKKLEVGVTAQRATLICLVFAIVPICVMWSVADPMLRAAGQDPEVSALVARYALIRMPGMLPLLFAVVAQKVMYATRNSTPGMWVQLAASGLSAASAIPLIKWYGFNGAALAATLQNFLSALGMLAAVCRDETCMECWGGLDCGRSIFRLQCLAC